MKRKLNYRIITLLAVSLAALFIGVPYMADLKQNFAVLFIATMGAFAIFLTLLEVTQDRVIKGIILISAGVLYQLAYPKYFYWFVDIKKFPTELADHFSIFGQVILLACSGAGASMIAVHADKTSRDYENSKAESNIVDNTKHIQQLIQHTCTLDSKLNRITIILAISLTFSAIILLMLIFK